MVLTFDFLFAALVDTIQLVQSLRSCLPAPHITVGSYKNDDQHRKSQEMGTNLTN